MIDGRGRWQRWQTKRTTEDMLAIPIAFIRRRWGLSRTWSASMQWHRGAQVIGEIGLAIYPGRGVQLDYKWNGAPITTFVEFDYTEQPSGGRRTWWRCPGCGRRCGILYGGKLFLCRVCHRLPYKTQMSGHPLLEAIDNQLYRLRRRLRATDISITDGPPGRKPHYMHWRTFERCRYAWQELLRLRDHALTVEVYALAGILRTAYALDNGVPPLRQADLVEDMQERWKEWKRGESHA